MSLKDIHANATWILIEVGKPRGQIDLNGVLMTAQEIINTVERLERGTTPVEPDPVDPDPVDPDPVDPDEPDEPDEPLPDPEPHPPAPNPGTYPHFEALSALHQCIQSQSLRTQEQINALGGRTVPDTWQYDPAEDAVRLTSPWNGDDRVGWSIAGTSHLWFPLHRPAPIKEGSVVFTFDWKWAAAFRDLCGGVTDYKCFQLQIGGKAWWTLMNSPGVARNGATGDPRHVAVAWDSIGMAGKPESIVRSSPMHPPGAGAIRQWPNAGAYPLVEHKWHRYVVELRLLQPPAAFHEWNREYDVTLEANPFNPHGDAWHMLSVWIIGEEGPPRRILFRVPVHWGRSPDHWVTALRWHMNSSKSGAIGQLRGWGRNFVGLANYPIADENPEADPVLFAPPAPTRAA